MTKQTASLLAPVLGAGLITLTTLGALRAQDQGNNSNASNNAACPGGSCHGGWKNHGNREPLANLTPAEHQELKAAMEQIKGNPQLSAAREAVKQARETLRQTRDQLLLQVDPKLQPILEKMHAAEPPAPPAGN